MHRVAAVVLFLATIVFVTAPFYTPPFTGFDPGEFPVAIPNPAIQPAPYAFSIWGLIYLWLLVHAAFGVLRRADHPDWAQVRIPLTVSVALGAVWLAIAGASSEWATVVIWVMLAGAMAAFLMAPTEPDRWLLSAPLAIYAGWLTAATAVSSGILLGGYGVLSDTAAALVMLGVVLAVAFAVQAKKPRMPLYGLTIVWALVGVIVTNLGSEPLVAGAAVAGALAILGTLGWLWRNTGAVGQIP